MQNAQKCGFVTWLKHMQNAQKGPKGRFSIGYRNVQKRRFLMGYRAKCSRMSVELKIMFHKYSDYQLYSQKEMLRAHCCLF